jgi:adenylate kinase
LNRQEGAYVGITGTPGTGKKTLAPLVASLLHLRSYSLNELAVSCGLVSQAGADEVDAGELGRLVSAKVKGPCLLYGHLLPYSFGRREMSRVLVLRCNPKVLRRRLASRGYPDDKVGENVEAELIGLVSSDSLKAFGRERVAELDTTDRTPSATSRTVTFRGPSRL